MKSINGPSYEYRGKAGGVEADKNDDVLTLQRGGSKGEIIFGRAGNQTAWQKVRNEFNQKHTARREDVLGFLTSRGMSTDDAKKAIEFVKTNNGQFSARRFEQLLQGKVMNHSAPPLTENETEHFAYKTEHGSQFT